MGFGSGDSSSLMRELLRITGGCAVIDGGLATELEAHGADLNDPLWSARCLIDSPHLIRKVHLDYLEAGANIIISASYQATIQGFESRGFSTRESEALLRRSVEIACEAREIFLKGYTKGSCDVNEIKLTSMQQPVLVAASIGSYGAYLADGSEYSGDYGEAITKESLKDFHRRRFQVLAESGADLIAFETIPNKIEAQEEFISSAISLLNIHRLDDLHLTFVDAIQAYVELLEESNINIPAWFSFNSKDGVCTVRGDSIIECASIADSCNKVVAVGINCTPPRFIHGLILLIRKVTEKPILIYPNSGETYDATKKEWVASTGVSDEGFVSYIKKWQEAGASLVGGCCRTTPDTIRAISRTLSQEHGTPETSMA